MSTHKTLTKAINYEKWRKMDQEKTNVLSFLAGIFQLYLWLIYDWCYLACLFSSADEIAKFKTMVSLWLVHSLRHKTMMALLC